MVSIVEYLSYVAQAVRNQGWVSENVAARTRKLSTPMSAWKAMGYIHGLEAKIQNLKSEAHIARLGWKRDMDCPRKLDVDRANEDLKLVGGDLAGLPTRTARQDRLLSIIQSGQISSKDLRTAAWVAIIADRIRREGSHDLVSSSDRGTAAKDLAMDHEPLGEPKKFGIPFMDLLDQVRAGKRMAMSPTWNEPGDLFLVIDHEGVLVEVVRGEKEYEMARFRRILNVLAREIPATMSPDLQIAIAARRLAEILPRFRMIRP